MIDQKIEEISLGDEVTNKSVFSKCFLVYFPFYRPFQPIFAFEVRNNDNTICLILKGHLNADILGNIGAWLVLTMVADFAEYRHNLGHQFRNER